MQYQPAGKEELGNMVQKECCVCVGGGGEQGMQAANWVVC